MAVTLPPTARARAAQPQQFADDSVDEVELLTREYAAWFYESRSKVQPTAQPSSQSIWIPLHLADEEAGRASLIFTLPSRPSRLRAIVEAHGAGRLGASELLIDSQ